MNYIYLKKMLNEIDQKREKKSNFRIKSASNQYQPHQTNNFRDIYINQSPTYFNQYRYPKENQSPYIRQVLYMHRTRSPDNYYQEGEDLEKTMKNIKIKPNYYLNDLNDVQKSVEEEDKKFVKRAVNTFTNKSPRRLGEKYYIIDNNHKVNINKSLNKNDGKLILSNKQYEHQSYQGEKYPKKIYNPFLHNNDYNHNLNIEKNEISKPVAQKICNITIKGETSNEQAKKFKSSKKRQKHPNYLKNNIEIEENIVQNSAIPDKNINFNINATKSKLSSSSENYNEEDYYDNEENENEDIEEIEEKEEGITISTERRNDENSSEQQGPILNNQIYKRKIKIERETENDNNEAYEDDEDTLRNTNKEIKAKNNHDINRDIELEREHQEEIEIEEDGDLEQEQEQEQDQEQDQDLEEGDGQEQEQEIEDEQIDQGEQIEQLEDDDGEENNNENNEKNIENETLKESTNRINKEEIEELEEESQQQGQLSNININNNEINKNLVLLMQKQDEIKLEGNNIQEDKQLNNIQEDKPLNNIQEDKPVNNIENNKNVIIQETNNEILKQVKINTNLDIINDDNLEFIGEKKPKIYEINNESNVELIKTEYEPIREIQKVQSLEQPRIDKKRIYKKQILNIIKNKENDVDILQEKEQEDEPEPIFEIQNVENFEQQREREKKLRKNKNINLIINKIEDNNFILENTEDEPEFEIENPIFYELPPAKIMRFNKKNKFYKLKIDQNLDTFEFIGEEPLTICYEIDHEIYNTYDKKIYKKSNYKKYKVSKRATYQYNSIQEINDLISSPKDLRFMIKGKPKKIPKKVRNVIKREVIYFYKSQNENKTQLSIDNTIKNTISPTYKYNNRFINNYISDKKKNSISNLNINANANSNTNNKANLFNLSINPRYNKLDSNDENREEKKYEKHRTYKTKAVVPSSLIKTEDEPIKQEHISIRRKYTNSRSNKNILIEQSDNKNNNNINNNNNNNYNNNNNNHKFNRFTSGSPGYYFQSSNNSSKDNIIKPDSISNIGGKQKLSFMSPKRNGEISKNENKTENDNENEKNNKVIGRNNTILSKYEQSNKNQLIKSEKNLKTQSYYLNKSNNINNNYNNNKNKNEITKTPITKENTNFYRTEYFNNNNNKNKSHTVTIFSNKQEPKNAGRTYISSNKNLNQNNINKQQTEKPEKSENKNIISVGRIYVNTKNNKNDPNDKKGKPKYVSTIYFSSNLDDTKYENKSQNKEIRKNKGYYNSSYSSKRKDIKPNKIYINTKGSPSNLNNINDKDKSKDKDINTNKNIENKTGYSFVKVKNLEKADTKSTNIINSENSSTNKDINNNDNNRIEDDKNNDDKNDDIIDDNIDYKIDDKNDDIIDDKINNKIEFKIEDINEKETVSELKAENLLNEKEDINILNNENNENDENNSITENNLLSNYDSKLLNKDYEVDNNNFDNYNVENNEISHFSKTYLNSYLPTSSVSRPVLSDFSKQFLKENALNNNRPELSNITRAYLISQSPMNGNDEDK